MIFLSLFMAVVLESVAVLELVGIVYDLLKGEFNLFPCFHLFLAVFLNIVAVENAQQLSNAVLVCE